MGVYGTWIGKIFYLKSGILTTQQVCMRCVIASTHTIAVRIRCKLEESDPGTAKKICLFFQG